MDEHASVWFRDVFFELRAQGKRDKEIRIGMYEHGIAYLKHVIDDESVHWNAKKKVVKDVLKMIEYSQGWIYE